MCTGVPLPVAYNVTLVLNTSIASQLHIALHFSARRKPHNFHPFLHEFICDIAFNYGRLPSFIEHLGRAEAGGGDAL